MDENTTICIKIIDRVSLRFSVRFYKTIDGGGGGDFYIFDQAFLL
ncbi:MAG TPA: hypothetical protein VFV86_10035 [Nitrososphaeraceae archaeon]|nr:hypothetical protein [Nitrososphaeraceae archaeon]